jgi:hypothetical protein
MRIKGIHSLIDDAASKSKHLAAEAAERTSTALGVVSDAGKLAATNVVATFKRSGHRVQEAAEKTAHRAEEEIVKTAHSAEEVVQALTNGVKEMAASAKHRRRELADTAARKLKPR